MNHTPLTCINHAPLTCPSAEFDAALEAINDDNNKKTREDLLTPDQIRIVRALLKGKPAVKCTARDIFSLYWHKIYSKKKLGGRLHVTVAEGLIPELWSIENGSKTKTYMHRPQAGSLAKPPESTVCALSSGDAANSALIDDAA